MMAFLFLERAPEIRMGKNLPEIVSSGERLPSRRKQGDVCVVPPDSESLNVGVKILMAINRIRCINGSVRSKSCHKVGAGFST